MPHLLPLLVSTITRDGPITFERFMDLALYDPEHGYYAGSARRTGRGGDFLTSVDVGPVFGELLARQFAEMHAILGGGPFDLVEAAAADGQLARDVLDAMARQSPSVYDAVRLRLVETSAAAREAQRRVLGAHASRLEESSPSLPDRLRMQGVIFANELLDALPCHAVVMTRDGLREIVVAVERGRLVEREAPLSTPEIARYFERLGVTLGPGWRAEVNLRAVAWIRDAARRLARGFIVLIDYGHRAAELYGASHSGGTRASYRRHSVTDAQDTRDGPQWLTRPGEVDITAHVDLTSIERAANDEGLTTIAMLDQTYFLLGLGLDALIDDRGPGPGRLRSASASLAEAGHWPAEAGARGPAAALKRRLALKTLVLPGGLGSTLKVVIFGRGVGTPPLLCCAHGTRLT